MEPRMMSTRIWCWGGGIGKGGEGGMEPQIMLACILLTWRGGRACLRGGRVSFYPASPPSHLPSPGP